MSNDLARVAEDSARGGFMLISGTAISTVILAVGAILIGRVLGPEVYGQYTLVIVVPQVLYVFADLGINQGVTKFMAAFNARNEKERMFRVLRNSILLKALAGLLLFAMNYFLADTFAQILLQRPDLAFYVRIASFSILFQVIFATASAAFVGLDKTEYSALTTNIQSVAKTVISMVLVLLGLGIVGALVGHVISYVAAAVASAIVILLLFRQRSASGTSYAASEDLKGLVRYGAPLYVAVLLTGFTPLFQNFVLASFRTTVTDADIGNYKAALNFATLVTVISIPITTALLPAFSKIDSAALQKLRLFFKHANKYTAVLIMPLTVLLIVYSTQVIQIVYGPTYQSASLFLATYCLLYFTVGIGYLTLTSLYNGIGQTKTTFMINLVTFVILAILSPVLTSLYGVQGLIAAFLAASAAGTVYGLARAKKKFQIEFDAHSLLKIYVASMISAIPSLLLLRFTHLSSVMNLIVGGSLYLAIYATLIPLMRIVSHTELQTASRVLIRIKLLGLIAVPVLNYQKRILRRNRS
jgi:O-antigen/teichoic acid export membrane protein